MRNTEPQEKWPSSQPPSSGPNATPMPDTPAHMPMARARSLRSVNRLVSNDKVAGMISAPPMPMNDRVAINMVADVANADATEPVTKISRPADSADRRPNRSPMLPAVSNRPANTSVYPSRIHCSWLVEAFRSSDRRGSATFRMVLSRLDHRQAQAQHRQSEPSAVKSLLRVHALYSIPPSSETQPFRICHVSRQARVPTPDSPRESGRQGADVTRKAEPDLSSRQPARLARPAGR